MISSLDPHAVNELEAKTVKDMQIPSKENVFHLSDRAIDAQILYDKDGHLFLTSHSLLHSILRRII